MAHDTFGARRYLTEELMANRSIDRQTLDECQKLRTETNRTLAEVLVSEGIVTDQQLGRLLEKFKTDGHISEPELNLLMNEFPANWERWKEMEERDTEKGIGVEKAASADAEAPETMPSDALVEEKAPAEEPAEAPAPAKPGPPEELRKKPLTERVHRGTLQEALEELMDEAPERDYSHDETKPKEKEPEVTDDPMIGRKVGGATILSKLGESGMGEVYKGVVESLGKSVSIRIIGFDLIKESHRAKFIERANAASKIEHRSVASIITVGQEEDFIYLISKFVEGESLRSKLDKVRDLPQEEALDIALQIARALRTGHADNIFHGDIKPENIIFDNEETISITDFGLYRSAEITGEGSSKELQLMGSPKYMAPEQFEAKLPDARTDIYLLGIVLYEMLCGKVPFSGPTMFAVRDAHFAGHPKPLTEINPDVNTTLAKLVTKMILKNPGERYQDITELVNDMLDLKQYLASGGTEPLISTPPAPGEPQFDAEIQARAQRYKTVALTPESEKKRGPFLKILLLILLLLIAAGAGIYHFRPDIRDRVKAYIFGGQLDDEAQAAKTFKEIKRKADLLLAQQKFLATLKALDSFPAKYATTDAGLEVEKYRDKIFDEADKAFADTRGRIKEFLKENRLEEALRKNSVLKTEVDELLAAYGESSPKAKDLRKYVDFHQKTGAIISSRLAHVKNFEQDMKAAEDFLNESKVEEALSKVTPYLESPIKRHREDSAELKERITAKKKELDILAAKDRERENFENALKAAKGDMSRGDFDLALSRIRPFKNSDEQEIILDAIEAELKIKKKRKEYLIRRAEETLLKAFMSDLNKGRQLLKDGQFKDVLLVVRKYDNGKLLTEAQKSAFASLTEEQRENIATVSKEQIEAFSNLTKEQKEAIASMSADQREAITGVTQEQIEAISNLTEEQKTAISALKEKADHNLEFLKDFEAIDKLIKQNKLRLARMRCARWRLDQNKELRKLANKKYAEIMGAMEPGMSYIEGGTAVVGWDDSADIIIARFDYDSDGKVSKGEFSGPHTLFAGMDENLDGFLAKGEFVIDKFDSDVDGRLSRKEFPAPDYIFTALDTNKDNVIAKDEMVMKEFDDNKDDALTAVEFAGYPDIFDTFDDNDDKLITKEEALVKKLDADKDGRISREEFVLPAVLFDAMDKDGDALITPDDDDANPRRHEAYHNFYIDRYEVSCRDYEKFVTAVGYSPPANWPGGKLPRQWHPRPVTGVTHKDASEYAKWAGKRLPTEAEWEVAASWDGEKKTLYPWGDKYIKGSANIRTGSAWKVGTESKDISPNGVYDLAGNVAEWTATPAKTGPAFIVRGCSADKSADPVMARTTRRSLVPSENATNFIGFRCVKDVK